MYDPAETVQDNRGATGALCPTRFCRCINRPPMAPAITVCSLLLPCIAAVSVCPSLARVSRVTMSLPRSLLVVAGLLALFAPAFAYKGDGTAYSGEQSCPPARSLQSVSMQLDSAIVPHRGPTGRGWAQGMDPSAMGLARAQTHPPPCATRQTRSPPCTRPPAGCGEHSKTGAPSCGLSSSELDGKWNCYYAALPMGCGEMSGGCGESVARTCRRSDRPP